MLQMAQRWLNPMGHGIVAHKPQLKFLHVVPAEAVGATAGVLKDARPPPRPLPLPEGVLRGLDLLLLFSPPGGPGAAPAAEAERDHVG